MPSTVLATISLPGIRSDEERRALALPKRRILRKRLVSCGLGLALSVAFYWGLFIKAAPSDELSTPPAPPNQAIYEWKGFCRVAPTTPLKGLNRL